MEKSLSNSNTSNHFRVKLLNASLQMQTALSIENLGEETLSVPTQERNGANVVMSIMRCGGYRTRLVKKREWIFCTIPTENRLFPLKISSLA
jgi:hypothetical protein